MNNMLGLTLTLRDLNPSKEQFASRRKPNQRPLEYVTGALQLSYADSRAAWSSATDNAPPLDMTVANVIRDIGATSDPCKGRFQSMQIQAYLKDTASI